MQDKEFDDVFRSKLDGFEAEPTGRVWEGIDEKLDTTRRRAIFMPILRIAASIILVAGLGILFLVNRDKVTPVKQGKSDFVRTAVQHVKQPETITPVRQPEPIKTVEPKTVMNQVAHVRIPKKENATVIISQKPVVQKEAPEIIKPREQPVLATVEPTKKVDIAQPVVPGPETPLVTKTITDNSGQIKAAPQVTAQVQPNDVAAKPAKRHGIHNFGDLVNIVVARVDKRKDKAIEFTDSDDGESSITAVNIGPVKIKRDTDK
ncbi:MAG TPA: hypothetical protein VFE54_12240 [Mucilaginibacter sp.]|nr:hypothetical protein [Mucilaginibacter sp.]